jgi:hypothetical protein
MANGEWQNGKMVNEGGKNTGRWKELIKLGILSLVSANSPML